MKTPDSTDSLARIIVYAPSRGKVQYARNADASSFTRKRDEAHRFPGAVACNAVLARCNGGGSFNCFSAFANL